VAPPAPRGAATPKAHREVVVEDGFKYKRRKSGTPGARGGNASHCVSGGAIIVKSSNGEKQQIEQRLSQSLPPDYPGLVIHENIPDDLPEEERMQMLIEEICESECRVERERLVKDFGLADGAAMASALEAAASEFQLKVEELVVRGDVQFDVSTTALREMRDAKEEAMRAVAMQLEDEQAQWKALETAAVDGAGPSADWVTGTARADAVEAAKAVRRALAAEVSGSGVLEPGQVALSVEEAKRRLEMQAEGLNAMVEGTEALCVRAERAAAVFSAALAEHDYRGLPHVNSPENLVKNLIGFAKK
tara:strand:- start:9915 stop:10829 length:915 start_codon:yes stop_codon:yes gene_type:complete